VSQFKAVPRFKIDKRYDKLSFKKKMREQGGTDRNGKELHQETAKELKGHARRLYMARVAQSLGRLGTA
jgi:hypothetical protein